MSTDFVYVCMEAEQNRRARGKSTPTNAIHWNEYKVRLKTTQSD
jgi:hypothetical protein